MARETDDRVRARRVDARAHRAVVLVEDVFEDEGQPRVLAEAVAAAEVERGEAGVLRKERDARREVWAEHAPQDLRQSLAGLNQHAAPHEAARDRAVVEELCDLVARADAADARLL